MIAVPVRQVAVCGAGAMGGGIAQVAAQAGAQVIVYDVNAAALEAGHDRLAASLSTLARRGKMAAADAERIQASISWSSDLSSLRGSELVIEAILEDLSIKQGLFASLEQLVADEAILASNTSSLPIARLARGLQRPGRFVGLHFFNPVPVMKLVEVVAGPASDAAVVDRAEAIVAGWEKIAVRVADVPGFIVNRVARPFYAEAFRAITERAAAPALIDLLFREAAGFRMGPLELTDLIGQDVNFAVARSIYDSYFGVARFAPQLAQAALVDAGWLGRKSGRGVYSYPAREDVVAPMPFAANPASRSAGMRPALGEARIIDGVVVRFSRGLTARSEATAAGQPVALLDWLGSSDGGAAAFAGSDECADAVAASLLIGLNRTPFRVADRPGLLIFRTLAQIANAAADAAMDGVSDEQSIDAAMRHGANYPVGPFAWGELVGRAELVRLLTNIWRETGTAIYTPSEYLSRT